MNVFLTKNRPDLRDATLVSLDGGRQRINGSISPDNRKTVYSFSLQKSHSFRATLKRLEHKASLTLFDESGARIAKSNRPGRQAENLRENLEAGTYFLQVRGRGRRPETDYRLRLATPAKGTPEMLFPTAGNTPPDLAVSGNASLDQAGNSQFTARDLGVVEGVQTYQDWVGRTDTLDYYRFSLSDRSIFSLRLTGLSADADLALIDQSGTFLKESIETGASDELINKILDPGSYFVRVARYEGQTSYTLTLDVTPDTTKQFDATVGYGLVDASKAVAQSINQPSFASVQNQSPTWGADKINAPDVWNQGFTGKGVTVAVLDSGVDVTHTDLNDNIWVNRDEIPGNGIDDDGNGYIDDRRGWDFVSNDSKPTDPNGHGTHVAGTIAAERNDIGVTGIAPDADIMPIRVLDENGDGSIHDIAAGIYYAIENGADVINLSLGGNSPTVVVESAIRTAFDKGVVVVMASGNESDTVPAFPAQYADQWGIAVGATDRNDNSAWFSNQAGSTPLDYVVAPGVSVRSTLPEDRYGFLSGTSMAAPHVSGIVALMLEANPTLTPSQVETHLIGTTTAIA